MRGFFAVLGLLPGLALGQVANSSIQTLPDTAQGDMVWVDLHELSVQQIFYMPFAAHFESGPYQLFSPNTAAANSISGNLSGVCVSAWVHVDCVGGYCWKSCLCSRQYRCRPCQGVQGSSGPPLQPEQPKSYPMRIRSCSSLSLQWTCISLRKSVYFPRKGAA